MLDKQLHGDGPLWQVIGWSRPPRNGHEKFLVRNGKPQPTPQHLCRMCKQERTGWNARRSHNECIPCAERRAERKRVGKRRRIQWHEQRMEEGLPKGTQRISAGNLHVLKRTVYGRLAEGEHFIVTIYDEPAYVMLSMDEYKRLKQEQD